MNKNNNLKEISEKKRGSVGFFLLYVLILVLLIASDKVSYEVGFDRGVDKTLDTVIVIMKKQLEPNQTGVTELIIRDTSVYFLSKKTLK